MTLHSRLHARGGLGLCLLLLSALAAPCAAQSVGSNGLYDVAVAAEGEYTARTGPTHPGPVGVNVLYNGDVLSPWTSWNSLRSYDSSTEYVLRGSPASAAAGFACRTIGGIAPPLTEMLTDGVQETGVRLTWQVAHEGDDFEVVQEVNAEGTAFNNSVVRVTLCVTNSAAAPLRLGMRFLFDWQIGEQDGAFIGLRPPDPPVEPYLSSENFWRPPSFGYYEVSDQQRPSVTPSLYRVAGTVTGPALSPPPTPPDWVQYIDWPTARGECFLALTAGRDIGAADSAVTYYWGYNEATALELAPGESFCATQYLFLYERDPPSLCEVVADLTGGAACALETVPLDASGSTIGDCTGVAEYRFVDPAGATARDWSTDPTAAADADGLWSVEVRCSDSPACTAMASADVSLVAVEAGLEAGTACAPGPVSLDASSSSSENCDGGLEYRFLRPDGTQARGWDAAAGGSADETGTWTVEVRCASLSDCMTSTSVEVAFATISPSLAVGAGCEGETIELDASASSATDCEGILEHRFLRPDGSTARDWDTASTAPADEAGTWTVEVRCAGLPGCVFATTAEVSFTTVSAALAAGTGCEGGTIELDASASAGAGCDGGLECRFLRPDGTPARDWNAVPTAPADEDGNWTVEVRCASLPGCVDSATALVDFETPPAGFAVTATDLDPCNVGLLLEWPADWDGGAWGDNGAGTFAVHRSEVSCEQALAEPPIATGLTQPFYEDRSGAGGQAYWHVIVAEAGTPAVSCPGGPERGAPFTTACLGSPATDLVQPPPPESIGAALRVRRPGDWPVLEWTLGPELRPFETDLVRRSDNPQGLTLLVDGLTEGTHLDEPALGSLLFYKVYRRNGCGDLSED
jgi:hypothetical protein